MDPSSSLSEKESGKTPQTSGSELAEPVIVLDHGAAAWKTVAGSFIVQFCTLGFVSAFGVYEDFYVRDFLSEKTPSDISWIGSFTLFAQYFPSIFVGQAFDAGYFRHLLFSASVLQVFSIFMLSLAKRDHFYQVFLSQAVGVGLSQCLMFLPSLAILGQHFEARRSLAMGIAVTGASIGGVVWPIMVNQLLKRTSFPTTVRATGGLSAGLLFCANVLMTPQPHKKPSETGAQSEFAKLKVMVKDTPFMMSIFSSCLTAFGIFFPNFYLQLFAIDKGIDKNLAFYVVAILNAGSFIGRLVPGLLAVRVGIYNMMVPTVAMTSILLFCVFAIHTFAGVAVFAAVIGALSGSYFSLVPSLVGQLSRHVGEMGTRMGVAFTLVGISSLIGTPIEGALLHHNGQTSYTWWKSIVFCGVSVMAGAVIMFLARFFFIREGRHPELGRRV
ncbi:major facilitator superfamily domain-containing protein [Mycena floridula]|nr:major facilitator superfamily domain-containing protein [Mycena floridula]